MKRFTLKEVLSTIGSMILMAFVAVLLLALWILVGVFIYCLIT